ncbi:hypothetical protein GCM10023172_03850 [Hymenobacter ginsengisoli]|uniref:Uncharacterized protein n=1 Tax=Hymenobacter ginsengisoli TaxID=1051626 RepID=A0ABP8PW56_9BACT
MQVEGLANGHYIPGIARQGGVLLGIVGAYVGAAGAHLVEEDKLVVPGQGGGEIIPDMLVAIEPIAEEYRRLLLTDDIDV